MHKMVTSCVGLALALLSPAAWAADSPKQAIQSVYTGVSDALSRKDIDAVLATRDEGYQAITTGGRIQTDGKEAERQRLEKVFAHSTSISDKEVVQSITMIGKDAAVVVKLNYTRTQEDPERGLVGKVHEEGTERAFWVNHDGKWLLKRERGIHVKTTKTVNGQPVK
jgi:ketosteroid isomerase-like protein